MSQADSSPPSGAVQRPQDYSMGGLPATPTLAQLLRGKIVRDGPLPFPDFMALALYEPTHGYYARGTGAVGRAGDFFTSVSIGPVFGELLAQRFLRHWQESGKPAHWRITECGAHDGKLAADLLGALSALDPAALDALEFTICEPLPTLDAAQRETLRDSPGNIRFVDSPSVLGPLPGIVFGNELLDALPFHLVEWNHGGWRELAVVLAPDESFTWQTQEIQDPLLMELLARLGSGFPEGYRTEIRPRIGDFLAPFARSFGGNPGLMLWIDYGFDRVDYYHPDRRSGTLRTFSKHRAGEDPLAHPGEVDITAHVDFTAVAEAAAALGGCPAPLQNQGSWLTRIAREWLLAQEGNPHPQRLRQFQTLTHPGHLGSAFQVLEIHWNARYP